MSLLRFHRRAVVKGYSFRNIGSFSCRQEFQTALQRPGLSSVAVTISSDQSAECWAMLDEVLGEPVGSAKPVREIPRLSGDEESSKSIT
jgi:hypothetical protein